MTTALSAGVSLKPQHYAEALAASADGLWLEVHPENYMVEGGPRLAWLEAISERHPLSLHGVALSLAADAPPDPEHLTRLRHLAERFQPALMSEHLAWSMWRGAYFPDLLPFPRSREALTRTCENISRVQDVLGRKIAIENPAHYLLVQGHDYGEVDFLVELARRSGCDLLLDVNNVFISAHNLDYSAEHYIDAVPGRLIAEVHLAGFVADERHGAALLIDSHDAAVSDPVWALYSRLVERVGPKPTLIEWDERLPDFSELMEERDRAHALLQPGVAGGGVMASLSSFQDDFARALMARDTAVHLSRAVRRMTLQPAFRVYRNTVMKGWIDALEANFPSVLRLVGEEWFRAASAEFERACPPSSPTLLLYGAELPAFLQVFQPAADLPYLPAVAELDRLSSEAHVAPDAPVLNLDELALLGGENVAQAVLDLHPSVRFAWFEHNAASIWLESRGLLPETDHFIFEMRGEGVLIVRSAGALRAAPLSVSAHTFLSACAEQQPIWQAVKAGLATEPDLDLADLLAIGAFTGFSARNHHSEES